MPLNREGTLTPDEVYALTAFLLYINGSSRKTRSSTPRVCRRSRCQLEMHTPTCLTGNPGRDGFRGTPIRLKLKVYLRPAE